VPAAMVSGQHRSRHPLRARFRSAMASAHAFFTLSTGLSRCIGINLVAYRCSACSPSHTLRQAASSGTGTVRNPQRLLTATACVEQPSVPPPGCMSAVGTSSHPLLGFANPVLASIRGFDLQPQILKQCYLPSSTRSRVPYNRGEPPERVREVRRAHGIR
jgi:hypothetical protein